MFNFLHDHMVSFLLIIYSEVEWLDSTFEDLPNHFPKWLYNTAGTKSVSHRCTFSLALTTSQKIAAISHWGDEVVISLGFFFAFPSAWLHWQSCPYWPSMYLFFFLRICFKILFIYNWVISIIE